MTSFGDFRVTINYSQQGQDRPYADSIYCARLSVEQYRGGKWIPSDSPDEMVKPYTQLVRPWKHEGLPHHQESFDEKFAPHLLKILIVGGYGTFGGRIVELLENEAGLTLVVAGRSRAKAADYCKSRGNAKATLIPALFDREKDAEKQLAELRPDIVIDASGPFQAYGENPYALVKAAIALGIHYMDLADGADFVDGIAAFDEAAKAANVFILSGVSSFPVLSHAVVQRLSAGLEKVTSISGGIAPSPFAGIGGNVIRAIAGYAGQKLARPENGQRVEDHALASCRRYTISVPGRLPLHNRVFSLVDVPDMRVLPKIWPQASVWLGAGPVPESLHLALIGLSFLVRWGIVKSLSPLASLMETALRYLRWGEHRGGMFIEVSGTDGNGAPATLSWHLIAEGDDGPYIPCLAVECAVRRLLAGTAIPAGARAPLADIKLEDYEESFAARAIYTGMRKDAPGTKEPLYKKILGTAWEGLPFALRDMHDVMQASRAEGVASVARGGGIFADLACKILGFPQAGENIPVAVDFTVRDGTETWTRHFNGASFHSHQYAGTGRSKHLVVERFGILRFSMALVAGENRLDLTLRRWSVLGLPLPLWLCPRSESFEFIDAEGRFNFNVRLSHPLTGLIVHYKGWLKRT